MTDKNVLLELFLIKTKNLIHEKTVQDKLQKCGMIYKAYSVLKNKFPYYMLTL